MAIVEENSNVNIIEHTGLYIGNSQFVNNEHLDILRNILAEVASERSN